MLISITLRTYSWYPNKWQMLDWNEGNYIEGVTYRDNCHLNWIAGWYASKIAMKLKMLGKIIPAPEKTRVTSFSLIHPGFSGMTRDLSTTKTTAYAELANRNKTLFVKRIALKVLHCHQSEKEWEKQRSHLQNIGQTSKEEEFPILFFFLLPLLVF